jgi:multidrug efflux pump subunit AcrA (membrane-fusion protein)
VSGRILLGDSVALAVPASSVVVRDGYTLALKLISQDEEGRVIRQAVEVGRRIGTEVEILSGLTEGDRVVGQGAGFLEDGDHVRVVAGTLP